MKPPGRGRRIPRAGGRPEEGNRTKGPLTTGAALAGIFGPALFAVVLAALTALQYDFMIRIGWRPLADPAAGWPSGLALGPHGWLLDTGFVLSGLLLMVFALGLHRGVSRGSRAGPALLFLSGAAMALLAFETDPIRRAGPRSPHGLIHDASFVVFVLSLLLSLLFLGLRMGGDVRWRDYARPTLATALVCAACLVLPGVAYYLFLAAALLWIEVTALRLWRLRPDGP